MKKIFGSLLVILFLTATISHVKGQEQTKKPDEDQVDVYSKPEQMPEFPGGEKKLVEFLSSNIQYPASAKQQKISGKVYVNFVVDKSGKIRNVKILRGIGAGCDEEVLRVMKLMPAWIPGKQGGKNVNVYFNLPVSFTLDQPEIKQEKNR